MVICLERGADLHTAQLMPLPLTVSCFSKIQIGFNFLVPAHLGSPGKRAIKQVCVCVFLPAFFREQDLWGFGTSTQSEPGALHQPPSSVTCSNCLLTICLR